MTPLPPIIPPTGISYNPPIQPPVYPTMTPEYEAPLPTYHPQVRVFDIKMFTNFPFLVRFTVSVSATRHLCPATTLHKRSTTIIIMIQHFLAKTYPCTILLTRPQLSIGQETVLLRLQTFSSSQSTRSDLCGEIRRSSLTESTSAAQASCTPTPTAWHQRQHFTL